MVALMAVLLVASMGPAVVFYLVNLVVVARAEMLAETVVSP